MDIVNIPAHVDEAAERGRTEVVIELHAGRRARGCGVVGTRAAVRVVSCATIQCSEKISS